MVPNMPQEPGMLDGAPLNGFFKAIPDLYRLGSSDTVQLGLTTIGGIVVIYYLLQIVNWLLGIIKSPQLAQYRHAGDDSWALVTGASDGIGKGFSEELLRRGFNVLLHGRNEEKLNRIRSELLTEWPKRKVDIVVADASRNDNAYEILVKKAESLPGKLTILVNNVGGQITYPQYVALSDEKHENLDTCINVNARFPTHLTASMIPLLKTNGSSLIINCGSTGGVMGVPYLATYVSTKAYIHAFTQSLKYEMQAEGSANVEVMGFLIGNTQSAGNPHDMPFFTIKARDCAASCLDRVGKGGTVVWSHWRHALQVKSMAFMPKFFVEKEMTRLMRERVDAGKKGL